MLQLKKKKTTQCKKKAKNEEIKSDMRLTERKHLNGSYKFEHINNHIKYE